MNNTWEQNMIGKVVLIEKHLHKNAWTIEYSRYEKLSNHTVIKIKC